ncbi:MAG TPA: DUF1269 domain-containing protein [Acidimicrobiales bacterium]|mgnify:FL=1|jgi:uncharacterized membrane protein|nr:DUF1269 domain-containing protein [Acidimicrobiales bacterium]
MNGLSDHDRGELVGIAFADTFRAQEYVLAITGLAAKHKLKLRDVVTLECSDDGTVRVHETIDPAPKQAALSGALWAGLFGLLLGGPVGWAAGAALGAGTGAATAKAVDLGVSDDWVDWFRATVQPNTTTVVLLIDDVDRTALIDETARFPGADLLHTTFDDATLRRIEDALSRADGSRADGS